LGRRGPARDLLSLNAPRGRDKLAAVTSPQSSDSAAARVERRFLPVPTRSFQVGMGLIGLGCVGLGAGVFGRWFMPEPVASAGWLLAAGAALVAAGAFVRAQQPPAVRVGALGITLGDPQEAQCLPWCDVQRIHADAEALRIETARGPLALSLAAHGRAAARIVAEAAQRIGTRLELSPRAHERLPALTDADAEVVPAARLQLAGRKCLASGVSITFESDAHLCEQCAALYHREHVPAACACCGKALGAPARSAAAS
jgi:hypothetical protein